MLAVTDSFPVTEAFTLTEDDREIMERVLVGGTQRVRVVTRVRILIQWDLGLTGPAISRFLQVSLSTVYRIRDGYRENRLQWILRDRPRSGRPRTITLVHRSQLTALACSSPPAGRLRWTITLLLEHLQEKFNWPGSRSTVWNCLIQHGLQPWRKRMWCINKLTPVFIARMMAVLEVYERPYDPRYPVICLDEKQHQLLGDKYPPQPMAPGREYREDHQYKRLGVLNFFVAVEPLRGRRIVLAMRRRTSEDFARVVQLILGLYPEAKKINLVVDNLSTHTIKAIRDTFPPEIAEPILERIIWVYTPVHASWLNMAENEISTLERQCLDRRFASEKELLEEVQSHTDDRNLRGTPINWGFTRSRAREKFKLPPDPDLLEPPSSQELLKPHPLPPVPVDTLLKPVMDEKEEKNGTGTAGALVNKSPDQKPGKTKCLVPSSSSRVEKHHSGSSFPSRLVSEVARIFSPRQQVTVLSILLVLWQNLEMPLSIKTLIKATGISRTVVQQHVNTLQDHGLVTLNKAPPPWHGRPPRLVSLAWLFPSWDPG